MTTRAQLRTAIRVAADQDASTFPDDTQINTIIDRAARAVWRRMLAVGWKVEKTTQVITATGAANYALSTEVSQVHTVLRTAAGTTAPLKRIRPEDLADFMNMGSGDAEAYDLVGGGTSTLSLELYPNPTSGTYTVIYSKRFPGFTSDTDNWFGPDGSDELIIFTAAIECVTKEADPFGVSATLAAQLERRWAEVIEAAGWMDTQGQQTVRDTRRGTRRIPRLYDATEGDWL